MRPQKGKQKLFDAAVTLFESQGYFATSVEQITAEAGVSKGLVYNYFSSKEELLVGLLDDATAKMAALGGILVTHEALAESLAAFVHEFFRFLESQRRFLRLQLSLLLAPELRDTVAQPLRDRAQQLLSLVHQWFQRAGVPSAKNKARVFLALLDGIALHALFIYKPYPLRTLKAQVLTVATALAAGAPTPSRTAVP
ncbi:MAG: TetR/AcrR family transcriptional regulator [Nannocystaceae bacterium]|nr:TetR/AcrR family transcriptional regulator [Nannocystaceae bacterium]